MWILDCDGDFLKGKKIWLRPGRTYLFGRTKPEGGRCGFEISHKSVSRKHLTVEVTAVKASDGQGSGPRSHLILRDEGTKVGTLVNGNKLRGEAVTLHDDTHHFRLGALSALFRILWKPIVLSFTFPSKTLNGGSDPLVPIRHRVEDLDIQAILPYDRTKTTHVVASKRNTAKCLQALINGKFVVDHSFIDAIVYAATPSSLDEPESLSPLEIDFDANWPSALEHVPAPSKEPGQRPAGLFKPDSARQTIFEEYCFVFCDQRQFENLMPPITNGGGRALQFSVIHGSTTSSEIVDYVRKVNSKKLSDPSPSVSEETVLLVRFAGEKGNDGWADNIQLEVQNTLGIELIEQNEFLDVILTQEPSKLKRAAPITTTSRALHSEAAEPVEEAARPPAPSRFRPGRPRGGVRSAFKGFDDGFGSFEATSQNAIAAPPPANPRKRSPPNGSDDDAAREDSLLPAAAAMKRRRLEEGRTPSRELEHETASSPKRSPRVKKEINIAAVVQERRKAQDEAARTQEAALQQSLSDLSFEEMNRLAQVKEMDVPQRKVSARTNAKEAEASARWDPAWNGRKNFKRFRRQGTVQQLQRGQTVIVPLEEVQKRTMGIGEHYWLEPTSSRHSAGRPGLSRQTSGRAVTESRRGHTTNGAGNDNEGGDGGSVSPSHQTFASARSHAGDEQSRRDDERGGDIEEIPRELADLNESSVIDVDEPRTTRQKAAAASGGRGEATGTASRATAKRGPGHETRGKEKRQKTTSSRVYESDSEDNLKFRIRRRKAA